MFRKENSESSQQGGSQDIDQYIKEWKSRLIDLSRRNKLIYFKHSRQSNLSILQPDAETLYATLVDRKKQIDIWMPPQDEFDDQGKRKRTHVNIVGQSWTPTTSQLVCGGLNRSDLEKILKKLNRRSLSDYIERGVRILYIAFGMLVWKEIVTGEEIRSPLIMVPIELSRKSVWEPFVVKVPPVEDSEILNPALQVKLKADYKIDLPPLAENGDSSLVEYLNVVKKTVEPLGWRVETNAEIGLFSFHKLVIYKDLESNSNVIAQHPIVRAVAGIKDIKLVTGSILEEKDVDRTENPAKTFRVLDADSSQRVSIDYALQGQSFVMQGPPGTGKSQTIANIISECIALGKSVLFVSDKMAALEVVYKRLKDVGLSSFCLELHSSKANKQEVVAELTRCLNEQLIPRRLPSPRDFEKLDEFHQVLNGYVSSLHGKHQVLEMSPYEVLGEIASLKTVPSVSLGLKDTAMLNPQRMHELESLVVRLSNVWQVVEEEGFPWKGYRGNNYTLEIRSELLSLLENLISEISSMQLEAASVSKEIGLEEPISLSRLNWLIELYRLLKESPRPEASWVLNSDIYQLVREAKTHLDFFEWRNTTKYQLDQSYDSSIFSLNLNKSAEIERALTLLSEMVSPSSVMKGELLNKQKILLRFVSDIPSITSKWTTCFDELAVQFGLSTENPTVERIAQISHFALLCFSDIKPEAGWFDAKNFQQVRELLPRAKKDYEEYRLLKHKTEKTYDDRIYELDLDEFVRRYNGPYRSILRFLRSGYYKDQKTIARFAHDGRVPKTVLNDLIDARKTKILKAEIDSYASTLGHMLGHFYEGLNTDFQKVEQTVEITSEIFRVLGQTSVPETLIKLVSYGSNPPEPIRWNGVELKQSVGQWNILLDELAPVLPNPLPISNLSAKETRLIELREWAKETEMRLSSLLTLVSDVLETSKQQPSSYQQLLDDLRCSETVRKKEANFLGQRPVLQAKFGVRFSDFSTDWNEIVTVLEWTKLFQNTFGTGKIPELLADTVSKGPQAAPFVDNLVKLRETVTADLSILESRFETELDYGGRKLHEARLKSVLDKMVMFRDRVDDLRFWVDFKEIKDNFSLVGLASFLSQLIEKSPPSGQLVDVFRKAAYQEWINSFYLENDCLGQFRRDNHEQKIEEFRRLDRELIHLSANRVIEAANNKKPQDILIRAEDSEIGVLLKESAKKRRLMPIRNLLQRMPNLLQRLKPCLLMSPISVSQFLPPELMKFDLVLYDEASQIVPEDAVCSVYRGKTIVVAGDNKQLPPTSFFQKSLIEDTDWDEISEGEVQVLDSILDECLGIGLPVKTLKWHYRSRHESLIAFSNNRFYNGSLITFPAAIAETEALGVKLVYVENAVYDRGGLRNNPNEAEVVANLVFEHFKTFPQKTLGVVTFSLAQMETVEEAIERRLREQPEYEHFFNEDRLEGFFVKNLENVQGDERDVMIFSVGYGRDQKGQMTLNFGPLNKAGGERRLNVAVTRARERVLLVTSIKSTDIEVYDSSPAGIQALRGYLEYAEKNHGTSKQSPELAEFASPLETDVASEVRQMDYEVVPKVGYSVYPIDMAVIDPKNRGRYLLAIECDGTTYRSSNSARDRDRLREQVLRQLGWRIHRVWSPEWIARRDSEAKRLKDVLEQASRQQDSEETDIASLEQKSQEAVLARPEVKQIKFGSAESIGVPYRVHSLKAVFSPYVRIRLPKYPYSTVQKNEFHFPENRVLQSRLLEELVNEEGPIHFELAVQRLANAWGARRAGLKIGNAVREALDLLLRDHRLTVKGEFLWPNNPVEVSVRVPVYGVPESSRLPEHIPPEELEKAMQLIAQYALGIGVDALIVETARVFGFTHLGEKTKARISSVYEKLLQEGKLIISNGVVTIPPH